MARTRSLSPWLAYYGDDLTGSTDVLEALTLCGVRAVLFLEAPRRRDLQNHPGIQAVGVAGASRAMRPRAMARTLRPALRALKALGVRHVHYKICSTFDSSPDLGSIGKAIDIGADIFGGAFTPVLGGAPALGRYCLFGNLFARLGIGSDGEIYRLDRHPSMIRHPVTPANESDLRRLLSLQTAKRIASFDVLKLALKPAAARKALDELIREGAEIVLFDAWQARDIERIGAMLEFRGRRGRPLFSVGPSSVDRALAAAGGARKKAAPAVRLDSDRPIIVASGSCSPVTAKQIGWALKHGFASVPIDAEIALAGRRFGACDERAAAVATRQLLAGRSVILHTSRGSSDPRMAATVRQMNRRGMERSALTERLGSMLGRTVRRVLEGAGRRRVLLAGGDSASFAARSLGVKSLEMIASLIPGAPICRAHAPGSPIDGGEIVVKGGQVGGETYFGLVVQGRLNP